MSLRTGTRFVKQLGATNTTTNKILLDTLTGTLPCLSVTTRKLSRTAAKRPATVRNNLKFKLHDDIERKFLNFYPDVIHAISAEFPSISTNITKLLTHTLSTTVIGKRYGLLVPRSYKELGGAGSLDEALMLGWGVELVRAANNLTSEIVHDLEKNRRGQETWHKKQQMGQAALSHVKILESSIFLVLRRYFSHTEYYSQLVDLFAEAVGHSAQSYSLDLKLNPEENKPGLQAYDMWRYKSLVYSTKTFPCLVLPVGLALHLAQLSQSPVHEAAKKILTEIGLLHQIKQDFDNCFKHYEEGDIARGRVTWLIVLARQRATPAQLRELDILYGNPEPEAIARVKEIYYKLKLDKNIAIHVEEKSKDIEGYIQQMAKVDRVGLSQSLFFKIHGEISSDDYTFIQSPGYYQDRNAQVVSSV